MITPSEEQTTALKMIKQWFTSKPKKPFVLGGLAGVGKSSMLLLIPDYLKLKDNQVHFCAYTGKASQVLIKKGLEGATTCHRLLYVPYEDSKGNLRFKKNYNLGERLELIIVDEASMIDSIIKRDLESHGIPVLYVGDSFQLPPISKDQTNIMLNCDFTLTKIHRQCEGNPIIHVAHMIRNGKKVELGRFGDSVLKTSISKMKDEWLVNASQVLCAKNTTRHTLNSTIRRLNGIEEKYPVVGDKMICLKNNYDNGLINGMIGTCKAFSEYTWEMNFENEEGEYWKNLFIEKKVFDKETDIVYNKEVEMMDFGSCITTHKSQGSSFEKVVLFEERLTGDWKLHNRWLYTGITRAIDKVIWITK